MLSIETISQRLADAKGKRERLISTLNRHTATLEKKEREFEKTYKLKPEFCSEESLRGNDKAFWDFYSIKSKMNDILSVTKRIQESEERIQSLQADLRSAEAQQAFMENQIPDVIKDFFVRWKEDSISFSVIAMSSIRILLGNSVLKNSLPVKKQLGRFRNILSMQNEWIE